MQYIVDRFETQFAVIELENKTFVNIPRSALPSNTKEGDVINVEINQEETKKRKEHILKMMNDVWAD